jgi:glycosyltransferase involved in cell wall biosynthesis
MASREAGIPRNGLRVLHVAEAFATGILEMVRALSDELVGRDVQVAIAYGTRPETPSDLRSLLDPEVALFRLPWIDRRFSEHLRSAVAIHRLTQQWQPDVVHLHSSFAGAIGAFSVPRRIPIVYTPHAYSFALPQKTKLARGVYRQAERIIARRVSVVGAVSQSEADLARKVLDAPRTAVVPNGIAEINGEAMEMGRSERSARPKVLAMGRMDPQRLPDETAQILQGVSDRADVLWAGGPKPGTHGDAPLRARRIPYTGWLERVEAMRHLRDSTIYLHWTAWDGHPISVLEAMASGVLVIGRDTPALREVLPSDQLPATVADAVALIRSMVEDHGRHEELLEAQSKRAQYFSAERMADDWLTVYERLTRGTADEAAAIARA